MKVPAAPSPAPVVVLSDEQKAEQPFDADAFVEKMNARIAEERSTFYARTIKPGGDKVMAVNIARSMVGDNNPKHEPYLTTMQQLVEAYDAELDRANAAERESAALREELASVRQALRWNTWADGLPEKGRMVEYHDMDCTSIPWIAPAELADPYGYTHWRYYDGPAPAPPQGEEATKGGQGNG